MSKEYWVMAALGISSILLLTFPVGRNMIRKKFVAFLVGQAVSWPSTILLVFGGRIEHPVRLFPKATDSNFMTAFVAYPAMYVAFYCYYPRNRSLLLQLTYLTAFSGVGALLSVTLQRYTNIVSYLSFSGYNMWLIIAIAFTIARIYTDWYFSQLTKEASGNSQ